MSTQIQSFYLLKQPDSEGRMLDEIWKWDNARLESVHDFIQWMFPLDEPSQFNPDAPRVTAEDQAAFRTDPALRSAMLRSLAHFLNFLGLELREGDRVARATHFDQRGALWQRGNHNWLRITRLLKSLRLLGFDNEARGLWNCLRHLHDDLGYVSADTFGYWSDAAAGLDAPSPESR